MGKYTNLHKLITKRTDKLQREPGLNHEIFFKSLLIIGIKWLADFISLKI